MNDLLGYYTIKDTLIARLKEPAPGRLQILTGPRQVGKTTLLLELASLLKDDALYLPVDSPEASLSGWWDLQWRRAAARARERTTYLLVDEVHYLSGWARLIKAASDQAQRERLKLHVILTGSAALTVGAGTRETMAGRFELLVLRQWSPRDMAHAFGLTPEDAVTTFVRFGSFPGGMRLLSDTSRWSAYIRDSIVDPAIGRDLLALESIRKPFLLRQVFAVSVGHPAEILSLTKIAGSLTDPGTLETISHYLQILDQAYLVAPIQKHSPKEFRRRSSPPKLIPLNNAFLSASSASAVPIPSQNPERWGRWLENACLGFAIANGQTVQYWREEPLEVDAVITGSWGNLAVEVKTGPFGAKDLAGLVEFHRRWAKFRPLVICEEEHVEPARRMGIESIDWKEFLWDGVPGGEKAL